MAEAKAAPTGEAWTRSLGSYYVVDLLGQQLGVLQGDLHGTHRPAPFGMG